MEEKAKTDEFSKELTHALAKRCQILMENEQRKIFEYDRDFYDDRFPMQAVPDEIQRIIIGLSNKFNVPYGAVCSSLLTASSGFLGNAKATIFLDDTTFFLPVIHSCLIGDSGDGKSPLTDFVLKRVKQYETDAKNRRRSFILQKTRLQKELEALSPDDGDERRQEIEQTLYLLEMKTPPKYQTKISSPEGLVLQLLTNEAYADLDGVKPDGLIADGECSRVFERGATLSDATKANRELETLISIGDGDASLGAAWTRRTNDDPKTSGIAYLFHAQTGVTVSVLNPSIKEKGFFNRSLFSHIPGIDEDHFADHGAKVSTEYATWEKIIAYVHTFNGAPFYVGYSKELALYDRQLQQEALAAKRAGDLSQKAFTTKLYGIVNAIALTLHIWKLAINGVDLNDSATLAEHQTIDVETFYDARLLSEYYRTTRPYIFETVEATIRQNQRSKTSATYEDKPYLKIKDFYNDVLLTESDTGKENVIAGEWLKLSEPEPPRLKAVYVKDIWNKSFYKRNQSFVEETLQNQGLLYIEPRTDRRVFISDKLTFQDLWKIEAVRRQVEVERNQQQTPKQWQTPKPRQTKNDEYPDFMENKTYYDKFGNVCPEGGEFMSAEWWEDVRKSGRSTT